MASVRKTKKLLKAIKNIVEITVKDCGFNDAGKVLITIYDNLEFNKFGVTRLCGDFPFDYIPYIRICKIVTL